MRSIILNFTLYITLFNNSCYNIFCLNYLLLLNIKIKIRKNKRLKITVRFLNLKNKKPSLTVYEYMIENFQIMY